MLNLVGMDPALASKAEACALHVADSQGLSLVPNGKRRRVKLGGCRLFIKDNYFLNDLDGARRSATPKVFRAGGCKTLSRGTFNELRYRLAGVTALASLIDEDMELNDVIAALDFVRDSGRRLPIDYAIAEIDFLAWRVLAGDLEAWFDLRFVRSRMFAA